MSRCLPKTVLEYFSKHHGGAGVFAQELVFKYVPDDDDSCEIEMEKYFPLLSKTAWKCAGVLRGDDGEFPGYQWTLAIIKHKDAGRLYFFIQGINPTRLITNGKFIPESASMAEAHDVKVTRITIHSCVQCGLELEHLRCCKPCKASASKVFYCSKSCQRGHWKVHKTHCARY